jgi:hypothetical protein
MLLSEYISGLSTLLAEHGDHEVEYSDGVQLDLPNYAENIQTFLVGSSYATLWHEPF